MKLIADSGSTKTTWILLECDKIISTVSMAGLNPYFHSSESVEGLLRADLAHQIQGYPVEEVHFYGAGCSTPANNRMISDAIRVFFSDANVSVYHDILGAARALFGNDKGIACILGTGCNSCFYDGRNTISHIDSLGYLFGDEGAGSYLGKMFLGAYLKKEVPDDLRAAFDKQYGYTLEDILNSLYSKPFPNRFLASFSLFLGTHREHPFVHAILMRSFQDFFEAHIRKYDEYQSTPVGFIGSIAYSYREYLASLAVEKGLIISRILASPLEGLVDYHKK
jgi:glucosamine kinase